MTKQKQSERDEAIARLRETLKPGQTVYTQLKHCSRSGMQRVIQLVIIEKREDTGECEPRYIGYSAALAMGDRYDRQREGIVIGGCGMDMGFALVYNLSSALWRDGFVCVGKGCPSNDHSNAYYVEREGKCVVCGGERLNSAHVRTVGDRKYRVCSPQCVKGEWRHGSGGYALKHRWI